MSEKQIQALVIRALKTFVQGALGVIVLNIANVTSLNAGKTLAIAAVAAGFSAAVNIFIKPEEAK